MPDTEEEKRITLRVPAYIYEGVVAEAAAKHLSINSYILQIISNKQYVADLEARVSYIEQQIAALQKERSQLE